MPLNASEGLWDAAMEGIWDVTMQMSCIGADRRLSFKLHSRRGLGIEEAGLLEVFLRM